MDLDLVQNTIEELESADTTFSNCQTLASLYIVRDMYKPQVSQLLQADEKVAKELSDLFPQYRNYREIKRKYQMKELPDSALSDSMALLCQELREFLILLYNNTELPEERECIQRTLHFVLKTA